MPRWLKQIGSYILSFWVYSSLLNPIAALVLLGSIAFHECGHLYAAKYMGLRTKGFYLIPFMGGAALIAERYKRFSQMAFVVLAGPMSGTLLSLVFFVWYLSTGSVTLGASTLLMAGMNLFNLVPLAMLDGGQLAESITSSIGAKVNAIYLTVSYALGAVVIWKFNPFISAMIVFFGIGTVLAAWRSVALRNQGLGDYLPQQPERMNVGQIILTVVMYVVTASLLIGMVTVCVKHHVHIDDLLSVKLGNILQGR